MAPTPAPAPPRSPPRSVAPPMDQRAAFTPREVRSWEEIGYDATFVEQLVLRHLLASNVASGRELAQLTGLPLALITPIVDSLKTQKLVVHKSTTGVGDFLSELSEAGRARAHESRRLTTYVGPAPVPWEAYLASVKAQSLQDLHPTPDDLRRAFQDLLLSDELLDQLGPAVASGRPMFLFGDPGNGKTSLAERMTRCFGDAIWVPHTILLGGQIVKLYDAAVHKPVDLDPRAERHDRRWVRIERPTLIAGGELTLQMLELQPDPQSGVIEAPLQLKANCGTLVIDDFGRGNLAPKDLLNRWIVPLEKRIDFLRLPDGRKIEVPFACLLVFSTNLEPRDLADEAFLRRIPYKINVPDPDEDEFKSLVELMADRMGVSLHARSVQYLIDRHYKLAKRPFRFCHPRDLLLQVKHLCAFEDRPAQAGPPEWDRVTKNYFGLM